MIATNSSNTLATEGDIIFEQTQKSIIENHCQIAKKYLDQYSITDKSN
jgi:hypothetical protein